MDFKGQLIIKSILNKLIIIGFLLVIFIIKIFPVIRFKLNLNYFVNGSVLIFEKYNIKISISLILLNNNINDILIN